MFEIGERVKVLIPKIGIELHEECVVIGQLNTIGNYKVLKLDGSDEDFFKENQLKKIPQSKTQREIELEAELKELKAKCESVKYELGQFGVFGHKEDKMYYLGTFRGCTPQGNFIRCESGDIYPFFHPITSIIYGDE